MTEAQGKDGPDRSQLDWCYAWGRWSFQGYHYDGCRQDCHRHLSPRRLYPDPHLPQRWQTGLRSDGSIPAARKVTGVFVCHEDETLHGELVW